MKSPAHVFTPYLIAWALTVIPIVGFGNPPFTDYPDSSEIPPETVQLYRLAENVWAHVTTHRFGDDIFPSNGLIVRDGEELLLVDTAWGRTGTQRLLSAIESTLGAPVTRVISTHFHDDRVGGTQYLAELGIATFATPLSRALARAAGNDVPEHDIAGLAETGKLVSFGPVQIYYPGAAHAADNIVIYVPEARLLFGGCAVHEASRKSAGNIADADLTEWPKSINRIRERFPEARIIVPGHGVPGGPGLLEHTITVVRSHAESL